MEPDWYLGEGLGAGWTDEGFLSSVPPLVVLQVGLVFECLRTHTHTGQSVSQSDGQTDRQTGGA